MNRKWKKILTGIVASALMVAGLTGCGGNDNNVSQENTPSVEETVSGENTEITDEIKEVADESLKTLRIGVPGADGQGNFEGATLAVKNGYFEEELAKVGYQPEYVYFMGAGPEINEAFAAGELDVAIVGDVPVFTAKSNGIDIKIIGLADAKVQYGILVGNGADINEPKDIEGKSIVVPIGTITQYYWENYAEKNAIDTDQVELLNSVTEAASLLQTGDAAAWASTKYALEAMEERGLGTVLETGADTSDIYTTYVMEATTAVLTEEPEIGVALNKALIRSYEAAIADPDAFFSAIASENMSENAWKKAYSFDETLSFLSPEIKDETIDYYNTLNTWLVEHGLIQEAVDIDELVDTSYYEKAISE